MAVQLAGERPLVLMSVCVAGDYEATLDQVAKLLAIKCDVVGAIPDGRQALDATSNINAGYRSWRTTLLSSERRLYMHALENAEDRRSAERRQQDSDSIGRPRFLEEVFAL